MEIIVDIAFWGLMSIVKFVVTPSIMVGLDYSVPYILCSTILGSAIGVQIFYHGGKYIFTWWENKKGKKKKEKVITPMRRRMVQFKNDYGLIGMLLISGVLSVPIASVIVAKYFNKNITSVWLLTGAFAIWSVGLTLVSHYLKTGNLF